ncbi:uncharacterized protein LOC116006755 [Ipomoea triloba]|uniref:uncharacterized protein LOC116006755 n=1 Tax=Ipomoea triloba TaxID=35885 RepID=UPI00125DAC33|nr:uncharacterized protein LOC116006755 [Ipomoea triloba]
MDVNQLAEHCSDLVIDGEEIGGLDVPEELAATETAPHWDLVGCFLTDRTIKFDHMQQVFASVWRPMMGMRVLSLEDDRFLFQFPHAKDMHRVIDDGPWSFENQTFVCKEVPSGTRPEDVILDTVMFWVQIHDLPTAYAKPEFIAQIGDYVGSFVLEDLNNFGGTWRRSYYRIRVAIRIVEPLKRRMKLNRKDGSSHWVSFKYERMSTFCFCCGLLGHSDKFVRNIL